MRISRRAFIATSAACSTLGIPAWATRMQELVATSGEVQFAPSDYNKTKIWGFGGTIPGPEIRVAQGARVQRRFVNDLPQASSVHWHGIRIENAMDGVPGLTQPVVERGDHFDYDFVVPDAGTYWYHSHNQSWEQVARGLYGPLIVEEATPPDVDRDITWMIDDWRLDDTAQIAGGFGAMHDNSHAGRLGNFVTVNGDANLRLEAKTNERLRLRLVNTANARVFELGFEGATGVVVALDGMPLETPEPLERVILAPAQRADVIVDITAHSGDGAALFMQDRDAAYALVEILVSGEMSKTARGPVLPLPPNPQTKLGALSDARSIPLLMEGGAMGGLRSATLRGESLPMGDLVAQGFVWALNSNADMPDDPLVSADLGETIRLPMTNQTAFPHGMHLHGHHFREVQSDGSLGPFRDTLLLNRGETREIAFVADNPGKWLLHCHMLGHQAAGMKTWLEVA